MPTIQQRHKLPQTDQIPIDYYEVMLSCWRIDPASRPTTDVILARVTEAAQSVLVNAPAQLSWTPLSDLASDARTESRTGLANLPSQRHLHSDSNDDSSSALDVTSERARYAFMALETARSNLTTSHVLGSGAFGEVKLGSLATSSAANATATAVAVKFLKSGKRSAWGSVQKVR